MKNLSYLLLSLILLIGTNLPAQYCIPTGTTNSGIRCLQISDIINYGSPTNQVYSYYPEQQFTTWLTIGKTYPVNISSVGYSNNLYKIWIDLNNDFYFSDNELLIHQEGGNNNLTTSLTIPNNHAYIGIHRLRVMNGTRWYPFDPCAWSGNSYGEAEDYIVHITDSVVLPAYCRPLPMSFGTDIENFKFHTIQNCASGRSANDYVEYPDSVFTTELQIGKKYPIYFSNYYEQAAGPTYDFAAFIDYNNNHTFEFSERVIFQSGYQASGIVTIPNNPDIIGTRKLRVRAGSSNACGAGGGETEDYWIRIIAAIPDTDTIVPPPINRWSKVYTLPDKQWGSRILETYDKGFIVLGSHTDVYTPYLLKISIDGDTLWSRKHPGPEGRYPLGFTTTNDGGTIQSGLSWDEMQYGGSYTLKTNACGDTQFVKYYYPDYFFHYLSDIFQLPDSNYMVTTHYFNDYWTNWIGRFGLAKLNTDGEVVWSKDLSKYYIHETSNTLQTSDGGYLFPSYAYFPVSWDTTYYKQRTVLIKTDSNGDIEWECIYDTINHVTCYILASAEVSNNGYISVGGVYDSITKHYFLSSFRTSESGTMQWVKPVVVDEFWFFTPIDLIKVNDNLFVIVTERYDACDYFDRRTALFSIDSTGNVLNQEIIGTSLNWAGSGCVTSNGKLMVVSTHQPSTYWSSIYTMKFNTDLTYDTLYNVNLVYDSICDSISPANNLLISATIKIKLYPNPANSFITVEIDDLSDNDNTNSSITNNYRYSAIIYNAQGIAVKRDERCIDRIKRFDLKGLKPGIYLLNIKMHGKSYNSKFVIQ